MGLFIGQGVGHSGRKAVQQAHHNTKKFFYDHHMLSYIVAVILDGDVESIR